LLWTRNSRCANPSGRRGRPGRRFRRQRIFSRGSFAHHGHAYGWWQNIPKTVRGDLQIDGEATAEADYAALHASILYGERGLKFLDDAYDYDVGDFPRITSSSDLTSQ
jgi:hypothetical protein